MINTKETLENFVSKHWDEINKYLDEQDNLVPIPFYSSVDIRESKTKYAPVDKNIYPAGFNNLCSQDLLAATQKVKDALFKINPKAKTIAVFPESHTKNLMYLDHLAALNKVIHDAGFEVLNLSFDSNLFDVEQNAIELISHSGHTVKIFPAHIHDHHLFGNLQKIDIGIFNNDQSTPLAIEWDLIQTPIVPTPKIGWFIRQKNTHFKHYRDVANQFCEKFNIDPQLIQADFRAVEGVDFETKEGLEKLANAVDDLILSQGHGTKVFVKASQGTYGMGISVVASGNEILAMNRKTRNKMDVGKNSIKFTSVLVQEGVETILKYDDKPAEITIYLINGQSVGGFMRINGERDSLGNLNSRGMVFRKLCMCDLQEYTLDYKIKEAMYSLIARLSTIAAGLEIQEVLKENK